MYKHKNTWVNFIPICFPCRWEKNCESINRPKLTVKIPQLAKILPGVYMCRSTKFQLDQFDRYYISWPVDVANFEKGKNRITSSSVKPSSKTTPNFTSSPKSNKSVLSTSVASSGWPWSNQGDAHSHKTLFKMVQKMQTCEKIRNYVPLTSNAKKIIKGVYPM